MTPARRPAMKPFLGLRGPAHALDAARVVVLPVPYERTVSFGRGTARGPAALLEASTQVETHDDELGLDLTRKIGIATAAPACADSPPGPEMTSRLEDEARRWVESGKFLLSIGGEHSITPPLVAAHARRHKGLSVLQFDAHLDLRESYEGDPHSHASAMARVLPVAPVVAVGIRNVAAEEVAAMNGERQRTFLARDVVGRLGAPGEVFRGGAPLPGWIAAVLAALGDEVYVSFDVDGLDPGVVPGTGTPEPGGLSWYEATALLRAVGAQKRIVGADVVELAPIRGSAVSDFACARLAYKILLYALGAAS